VISLGKVRTAGVGECQTMNIGQKLNEIIQAVKKRCTDCNERWAMGNWAYAALWRWCCNEAAS
jgi:hypothetical protein